MAEARDDSQERTEQPTPKRLQEARRKGQVARSRELNTVVVLLAGGLGLVSLGSALLERLLGLMDQGFRFDPALLGSDRALPRLFAQAALDALQALAPFMALMVAAALVAPLALGGLAFSAEALAPKLGKLDPVKGLKRLFSAKALMELLKALAKFLIVTGAAVLILWNAMDPIIGIGRMDLEPALAAVGWSLAGAFVLLSAALLLVAAVDVPFQIWDHTRQLKMTRQEVRDEFKETEGKPEVKSRIRQLQREVAQRRMMEKVPEADVVIVNPEHFSVALRYAEAEAPAPVLVAKGADRVALRIREVAKLHGVPVVRAPALARAVFHHTKLDQQIPAGLYLAVAQVLAYVMRLRARPEDGVAAPDPDSLPIPDALRFDP